MDRVRTGMPVCGMDGVGMHFGATGSKGRSRSPGKTYQRCGGRIELHRVKTGFRTYVAAVANKGYLTSGRNRGGSIRLPVSEIDEPRRVQDQFERVFSATVKVFP